jgi:MATE family multidrug resistance protein
MDRIASATSHDLIAELRQMLRLAIPVVIAELGWMFMSVVDTIMVGHLGPAAIGATGVGSSAFYALAIFGMGLLLGLDTLVSQAFGAGNRNDCHHSLAQGIYLALALTPLLMVLFYLMPPIFEEFGINRAVSELAGPFVTTLSWGTFPLLLYGAFRRYLQGIGHVRPVMFVLLSSNLVNWFGNWLLIDGHWHFPAMGVTGSALSTCIARLYMAFTLATFIWWIERDEPGGLANLWRKPDPKRLAILIRLGFPAASQIFLEIAAFGAAAMLAGRLEPAALAAHQISINCAALAYMVPLGIASAAAVAVGQAIGRKEPRSARHAGYVALAIGCVFMCCSAFLFAAAPLPILRVYTSDSGVLETGRKLLAIAAVFQLFDGIQTVATGALRGLGNTRTPMLVNLAGYWVFGLPLGYFLCFYRGWSIYGLWIGLSVALIAIAVFLLYSWNHHSNNPLPAIVSI